MDETSRPHIILLVCFVGYRFALSGGKFSFVVNTRELSNLDWMVAWRATDTTLRGCCNNVTRQIEEVL